MSGNAMEEALFGQMSNPTHTDPARVGFLSGTVAGLASVVAVSFLLPLTPFWFIFLWLISVVYLGAFFTNHLKFRIARRKAKEMIARQGLQVAETQRQIADMKTRGYFDKWSMHPADKTTKTRRDQRQDGD